MTLSTPARMISASMLIALAGLAACSPQAATVALPEPVAPRAAHAASGPGVGVDTVSAERAEVAERAGADGPAFAFDAARQQWARPDPATGRFDPATAFEDEQPGTPADNLDQLAQQSFAADGADFDPFVSRDGKWLVFASTQHRPNPDLYIKTVGSRTVTQLTSDPASDVMPEISPDGTRVAFASNRSGAWNIYVMPATGGQAVQITSGSTQDLHPTWSPDGSRLAFCRLGQASGRWELWVVEVARPQVAEYVGLGVFPRWCPVAGTGQSGRDRIAFQRGRERGDRAFSVWTIDYKPGDAGNPTEIVSAKGLAAINPGWSPDGSMMTYALVPVGTAQATFQRPREGAVWLASVDGSARSRLTSAGYLQSQPVWGGDGLVYFVSNRGGIDQVWSTSPVKALAAMGRTMNVAAGPAGAAPMAGEAMATAATENP